MLLAAPHTLTLPATVRPQLPSPCLCLVLRAAQNQDARGKGEDGDGKSGRAGG